MEMHVCPLDLASQSGVAELIEPIWDLLPEVIEQILVGEGGFAWEMIVLGKNF